MCNIVYILLFSWNNFLVLNIPWASSIYLSPLLSGTLCSLYGIYSFTFSKCHIVRIVQCLVQAAVTKIPSIWWHNQQTFTCHSHKGREVQDQGTESQCLVKPISWFTDEQLFFCVLIWH